MYLPKKIYIYTFFFIFFIVKTLLKRKQKYAICNIKPFLTFNCNKDIAIVYVYTSNIEKYAKHSILNIMKYCNLHGYGFILYNKSLNQYISPCWNKVAVILKHLKRYKYLVWMDADAIIVDHNIKFEDIINVNLNYDLLLTDDISWKKECINSGVMIIKNSEWCYNLFTKVWKTKFPKAHNDQNVILYEITKEVYPNTKITLKYNKFCMRGNIHPKVIIFKQNYFNTNIKKFHRRDFVLHLMNRSSEDREHIMRQVNTKLGFDNYKDLDCINLIQNGITDINTVCFKNPKKKKKQKKSCTFVT